jgi:hypothetical protein
MSKLDKLITTMANNIRVKSNAKLDSYTGPRDQRVRNSIDATRELLDLARRKTQHLPGEKLAELQRTVDVFAITVEQILESEGLIVS